MDEHFLHNILIEKYEEMLQNDEVLYFDADDFCEIITYYLDINNIEMAKKAIKFSVEQHPADSNIKLKQLEFYIQIKKFGVAEILIDELKQLHTDSTDYNICLARYHSLKKEHHIAIHFYKKALKNGDEKNYLYNCIGTEYYQFLDEPKNALLFFKKGFESDLEDDFSFFSTIQCYNDLELHLECITFIDKCIDEDPYWEDAWFQKGLQLINIKNYKEAYKSFDYASLVNEKGISNYMQKAYCCEKLQAYNEALKIYYEITEIDPSSATTYLKIGKCYHTQQKYTSAIRAFQQALRLDPQMDKIWDGLAETFTELEDWNEAVYHQKRALDLDSENITYYKKLAYHYINAGFLEEATDCYSKILKDEPEVYTNWLALTELLISLGEYQKASHLLIGAMRKFDEVELIYVLSFCYYKNKQDKKGLETLSKAIRLNPSLQKEMFTRFPLLKKKK